MGQHFVENTKSQSDGRALLPYFQHLVMSDSDGTATSTISFWEKSISARCVCNTADHPLRHPSFGNKNLRVRPPTSIPSEQPLLDSRIDIYTLRKQCIKRTRQGTPFNVRRGQCPADRRITLQKARYLRDRYRGNACLRYARCDGPSPVLYSSAVLPPSFLCLFLLQLSTRYAEEGIEFSSLGQFDQDALQADVRSQLYYAGSSPEWDELSITMQAFGGVASVALVRNCGGGKTPNGGKNLVVSLVV